jgi:hypothetical protein
VRRALLLLLVAAATFALLARRSGKVSWGAVQVVPSLEARLADGSYYTPSTQSFLRGEHWLEGVVSAQLELAGDDLLSVELQHAGAHDHLKVVDLPVAQIVPRLHYTPAGAPDAFDAFNLRLAEYARNSLSVPIGTAGDSMAHFETTLEEGYPWQLEGDYEFVPNTRFRPVRFGLINNCLRPGLWEFSASDRSGEIYHAWFELPAQPYIELVARTNGLEPDFVRAALEWNDDEVGLELERLRTLVSELGRAQVRLASDASSGYSSQDSRRKLAAGYAKVEQGTELIAPAQLSELTAAPVHLSSFVEPGRYSNTERRRFDMSFLRAVRGADVRRTLARTHFDWRQRSEQRATLELQLDLGPWQIVLGNLPPELLVPQEDLALHGFGVGVLSSGGFAERRAFLIEDGPAPSFAYLCRAVDGQLVAVNSHDYGLEQVFVRTHERPAGLVWELTLTSYERIVDIVKYEIVIPAELHAELRQAAANYQAPLYRTYRDDNLR